MDDFSVYTISLKKFSVIICLSRNNQHSRSLVIEVPRVCGRAYRHNIFKTGTLVNIAIRLFLIYGLHLHFLRILVYKGD